MTKNNIGEALLILGTMYFHFVHELNPLATILLVLFGLFSWTIEVERELKKNK